MRIVAQRVRNAQVSVNEEVIGRIDAPGLLLLVGVTHSDTVAEADRLAEKVWRLRILPGETSCADRQAPILAISQFTLYANTRKGRRPSWSAAAPGSRAEPLFDAFVDALRDRGAHVETGRFGAEMAVSLVNEGPMTVILDSDG